MTKAIEIKNLEKIYGKKPAVNKMSLDIEDGELFALLGVNGAGKTTTIKMLTGLVKPTSGEAFVEGKSILTDMDEIKKQVNVSPQETAVAPNLSVKDNLEFIASIYDVKDIEEKVNQMIEKFDLGEVENTKAKILSGGWQRRLSIAMALISEPKIIFLDEPTLGLDVLARRELWDIIRELHGKITIVLTTHYMEEAEELSDRIGIMKNGFLIDIDTAKNFVKKTKAKNFEEAFVTIVKEAK